MLNKSRAIVLHQLKFGESSLIVTLYTEKHGRLACMVNGARARKSKVPANLFQPLTLLESDYYYRENRDLQRLKETICSYHYTSIPFSITKKTIALFLAETLYLTLREEESNPVLFSFLFNAFQQLDKQNAGTVNFHLWFMLHYAGFLGFLPVDSSTFRKDLYKPEMQVFQTMPAEAASAMVSLLDRTKDIPDNIVLSNQHRSLLLERIVRHYAQHIDGFSRLKSLSVLREVFE